MSIWDRMTPAQKRYHEAILDAQTYFRPKYDVDKVEVHRVLQNLQQLAMEAGFDARLASRFVSNVEERAFGPRPKGYDHLSPAAFLLNCIFEESTAIEGKIPIRSGEISFCKNNWVDDEHGEDIDCQGILTYRTMPSGHTYRTCMKCGDTTVDGEHLRVRYKNKERTLGHGTIDMDNMGITELGEVKGLAQVGPYVEELLLSENRITHLRHLELFPNLRRLVADRNPLEQVEGLGKLKFLDEVYLGLTPVCGTEDFHRLTPRFPVEGTRTRIIKHQDETLEAPFGWSCYLSDAPREKALTGKYILTCPVHNVLTYVAEAELLNFGFSYARVRFFAATPAEVPELHLYDKDDSRAAELAQRWETPDQDPPVKFLCWEGGFPDRARTVFNLLERWQRDQQAEQRARDLVRRVGQTNFIKINQVLLSIHVTHRLPIGSIMTLFEIQRTKIIELVAGWARHFDFQMDGEDLVFNKENVRDFIAFFEQECQKHFFSI